MLPVRKLFVNFVFATFDVIKLVLSSGHATNVHEEYQPDSHSSSSSSGIEDPVLDSASDDSLGVTSSIPGGILLPSHSFGTFSKINVT